MTSVYFNKKDYVCGCFACMFICVPCASVPERPEGVRLPGTGLAADCRGPLASAPQC